VLNGRWVWCLCTHGSDARVCVCVCVCAVPNTGIFPGGRHPPRADGQGALGGHASTDAHLHVCSPEARCLDADIHVAYLCVPLSLLSLLLGHTHSQLTLSASAGTSVGVLRRRRSIDRCACIQYLRAYSICDHVRDRARVCACYARLLLKHVWLWPLAQLFAGVAPDGSTAQVPKPPAAAGPEPEGAPAGAPAAPEGKGATEAGPKEGGKKE
jgi:hypothetical protein